MYYISHKTFNFEYMLQTHFPYRIKCIIYLGKEFFLFIE